MSLMDLVAKFKSKLPLQNGLCSINFMRDGLAFVQIEWNEQKTPVIKCCDFIPLVFDPDKIMQALAAVVRKNNCQGVACNWVLQAKDYDLISIPDLPVPAEELITALRWHIKEQIDFPATEAAIDYFKVPYLSKTQKEELIYVVVARKNYLNMMAKIIVEAGLNLSIIEIPEFAVRNVAELFAEKGVSIGVIEVYASGVKLIIMQDGFVFLVRRIEIDLLQAQRPEDINVLITEIQRSCDYYENGLGQTPAAKFLLISPNPALATQLTEGLSFPVESIDLNSKLAISAADPAKLQHCLYAIGGALRQEVKQ